MFWFQRKVKLEKRAPRIRFKIPASFPPGIKAEEMEPSSTPSAIFSAVKCSVHFLTKVRIRFNIYMCPTRLWWQKWQTFCIFIVAYCIDTWQEPETMLFRFRPWRIKCKMQLIWDYFRQELGVQSKNNQKKKSIVRRKEKLTVK